MNDTANDKMTTDNTPAPDNTVVFVDYISESIKKIDKEEKAFSASWMAGVVKERTAETIRSFCKQSTAFAEVVFKTKRTLSECCESIVDGISAKEGISDIDAFKKAVKFYFPDSDVEFQMLIHVGTMPTDDEMNEPSKVKAKPAKPKSPAKKPIQDKLEDKKPSDSAPATQKSVKKKVKKSKAESGECIQISLFD